MRVDALDAFAPLRSPPRRPPSGRTASGCPHRQAAAAGCLVGLPGSCPHHCSLPQVGGRVAGHLLPGLLGLVMLPQDYLLWLWCAVSWLCTALILWLPFSMQLQVTLCWWCAAGCSRPRSRWAGSRGQRHHRCWAAERSLIDGCGSRRLAGGSCQGRAQR